MISQEDKVAQLFEAAVELETPGERAAYLDAACGDDQLFRAEIEELLRHDDAAGSFLGSPDRSDSTAIAETSSFAERPGSIIGPYKLLEQIGEGGFGVVFMAEQIQPVRRTVALKILKPGMDSRQIIARFEVERQALAMMDHINIARVLDAGTTEAGRPYFVMELVNGVPITKYCDDHRLTPKARLELFVPVCLAIQHAHQKGIIHRDIKPSNVMITLNEGKPIPKVIDFGVAKATEQRLTERTLFTQYGTMVGTLEYMSPEQAEMNAAGADTRSDIYSLGVLLFELLTGSTPLTNKRVREAAYAEVLRMIKEEEAPKPSSRLSDSGDALESISAQRLMEPVKLTKLVRGELDWIVMKTLEKDRNLRYETASAFALDVQRYLNDEPVQACAPTLSYRLRKFVRRNRGPVLVVGVVFLALLVGVVGTTLGMVQAKEGEKLAHDARDRVQRERDAAVEARKETFDALIDLTDFTDQHLLFESRTPGPAERDFLQRMVTRYERLAATPPDTADAMEMQARSLSQVGQNYMQLGDQGRGLEAWRKAAALYRGLPAVAHAETATARNDMRVHARRCRAVALTAEKLRQWKEAVEFAQLQLAFARAALSPEERPDADLFNLQLTGNWSLTISQTAIGQMDDALASWEEMLRLVVWFETGGINDSACEQLGRIAIKLTAAGKTADATAILAPGMTERRARLAANPGAVDARIELRRAHRAIGLIHEKAQRFQDALGAYDKAIEVDRAPPVGEGERYVMYGALIGRAVCLDALDRESDAEAAWKTMYKFIGNDSPNWYVVRMMHLVRNGRPERAIRMAEDSLLRPGSEYRYNAACVYATASAEVGLSPARKEELARRAVVLLEEIQMSGFLSDPTKLAMVKTDADLKAIRGRDDFKALMVKMEPSTGNRKSMDASR